MDDVWTTCYQRLLPFVDDVEALEEQARQTILRQWHVVAGVVDLSAPAVDDDAHLLVGLSRAYNYGWLDGAMGRSIERSPQFIPPHGWPELLTERLSPTDAGRGRAFGHKTKGELADFFGRFHYSHVLVMVADARSHAEQTATLPTEERVRRAVDALCSLAWERCRDDIEDAPWYAYLDLNERLAWLAAALSDPGLLPLTVFHHVDQILERTPDHLTWSFPSEATFPADIRDELTHAMLHLLLG